MPHRSKCRQLRDLRARGTIRPAIASSHVGASAGKRTRSSHGSVTISRAQAQRGRAAPLPRHARGSGALTRSVRQIRWRQSSSAHSPVGTQWPSPLIGMAGKQAAGHHLALSAFGHLRPLADANWPTGLDELRPFPAADRTRAIDPLLPMALPDSGHSARCLASSLDNNCLRDSTIRICAANSR